MLDQQREEHLEKWMPGFQLRSYNYYNGPVRKRPCRDICCLIAGAALLVGFVALAIYTILVGSITRTLIVQQLRVQPDVQLNPETSLLVHYLGAYGLTLGSMFAAAGLMSVGYAWLLLRFPKCAVYAIIAMITAFITSMTVCCFVFDGIAIGVITLVMLVVWLLVMSCCYRRYIAATVVMAKIAGIFAQECLSCIFTSILGTMIAAGLALFWAAHITAYSFIFDQASSLYILSLLFVIFLILWTGYAQTFLTASFVAHWYYKEKCQCSLPFRQLFHSHLGSITFAALIIPVIYLVRALSSPAKYDDNTCKKVCRCLFLCCFSSLEGYIHSMNHYALILTAIEGDSFTSGARSAGVLYHNYTGSFAIINLLDRFFSFVGILQCTGVPVLLGVLILGFVGLGDVTLTIGLLGIFGCMLSCIVMISTVEESICSIFVLFCL